MHTQTLHRKLSALCIPPPGIMGPTSYIQLHRPTTQTPHNHPHSVPSRLLSCSACGRDAALDKLGADRCRNHQVLVPWTHGSCPGVRDGGSSLPRGRWAPCSREMSATSAERLRAREETLVGDAPGRPTEGLAAAAPGTRLSVERGCVGARFPACV
jgi:hypothetical protein